MLKEIPDHSQISKCCLDQSLEVVVKPLTLKNKSRELFGSFKNEVS